MPRKKKPPLSFVESMLKMQEAGIFDSPSPNIESIDNVMDIPTLEERLKCIFQIVESSHRPANYMLFFVMYDIESNKVRRHVVKYLERKGCTRVQKSIFLADLPSSTYNQIRCDLADVQACYDNEDSILIVPITTDYLKAMKVIGQSINIDVITKSKNTIFF